MGDGNSRGWLVIAGACALWSLWAAVVAPGMAARAIFGSDFSILRSACQISLRVS